MIKKSIGKAGIILSLLLLLLSSSLYVSAKENGYWTMKTDEAGLPVMIYTYTEPVEWTVNEAAGYGHGNPISEQPAVAVEQAEQAPVCYASPPPASVEVIGNSMKTSHPSHPVMFPVIYATLAVAILTLPVLYWRHKKRFVRTAAPARIKIDCI